MSSVEAKLVYDKYDEMIGLLKGYREKKYQQWVEGVDQDCHFNLGQPLIQRDPFSSLIQVNFSKAVCPGLGWGWGRGGVGLDGGGKPWLTTVRADSTTLPPTLSIYGGCSVYMCVRVCVRACVCAY